MRLSSARWLLVAAVALTAAPTYAAKLHGAGNEARPHTSPAVPSNPPTYPRDNQYQTPERDPSRSSADANVWPQYIGNAWWQLAQLLMYLPFGLPQDLLEKNGPRAFVYEGRPYGHHGKGIVRTEPLDVFEQRLEQQKTGPRLDPRVYQYGPPPNENNWVPGEEVTQLEVVDENGQPIDDPIAGMRPPDMYPPLPVLPDWAEDWRNGAHTWAAQIQLDVAYIDNNTWRARPRFRLFTPTRFELDGEFAYYHESLDANDARLLRRTYDWLGMSTAHIAYRFAQSQAVQFRAGVGPRFMVTPDDSELGFDTYYAFDAFIHDPLVLSGSVGLGTVGHAFVSDLRIQLGFVLAGIEGYGGVERLGIGHSTLWGPVAGLRYWF